MKRTLRFIWLLLLAFAAVALPLSPAICGAGEDVTTTGGAGYYIRERVAENDLGYLIKHFTDHSTTIRNNAEYLQQVNVLEVPAATPAKIISYANLRNHKWTLTSVRKLAEQFEEENPDWKVIAAVNADFFDINGILNGLPYQTHNPVVTMGEFYKTSVRTNVLGFTNDGSTNTLIAGGKNVRTPNMILAVYDDDDEIIAEFDIEKINAAPGAGETAVFFGYYDDQTQKYLPMEVALDGAEGFFIEDAELALPNNANDFYGKGRITARNPFTLEKGQFAIATKNQEVAALLDVGVKVRAQFEFAGELARVDNATGYQGKFLEGSEFRDSGVSVLAARHPRTAVGVRPDGSIVMAVIDGRQAASGKEGVFGDEMAAIMKKYGCAEAYNLDGGGSSTMIIRKDGELVVVNSPSDGRERSDANCLLIAVRMPEIRMEFSQAEDAITVSAELIAANNHDIQKLYIDFNGELREVGAEEAVFSGLNRDTEYYYAFKYRDSAGILRDLLVDGRIKTLKRPPVIIAFEIYEYEPFFHIILHYDDPDYASRLNRAYITLNGRESLALNGQATFAKTTYGSVIKSLSIRYQVDLNDGEQTVISPVDDYLLKSSAEIEAILVINGKVDALVEEIYR